MKLSVKNEATSPAAEIFISGVIGESWWDTSLMDEKRFRSALDAIPEGRKIKLYWNSPGGSVADGLAMHSAIKRRRNDITSIITGEALSIASYAPLAASKVVTPRAAVWMVHKPWTGDAGNADRLRKTADALDTYETAMVAEYVAKTGQKEEKIREDLRAETWMSGEEAVAYGLADELSDEPVTFEPIDSALNLGIRRMPEAVAARRKPTAQQGGDERNTKMNRSMILALLKKHGVTVAEDAPDEKLTESLETLVTEKKVTEEEKAEAMKNAHTFAQLSEQLVRVTAQLERERNSRITKAIDQAVVDGRIPVATAKNWTARALKDETVLDDIAAMEPRRIGTDPVRGLIKPGDACALDTIRGKAAGSERINYMIENWGSLRQAEASGRFRPMGANTGTDSATLLGTMQSETAVTVLQTQLAPLRALSMDMPLEPMVPRRPVIVRVTTAGGTAQTNATSFEDTTNFVGTVAPITVTPAQLTAGGYLTNAELNSGNKMSQWATIKAQEIAQAIMGAVATVITTANFTETPLTSASSAFSGTDLNALWGQLAKAPTKYAVISSTYMAKLLPTNLESINGLSGWPGWAGVFVNDYWTGATANTTGFVCHPQAIAAVMGEPVLPESAGRAGLTSSSIAVPGLGVSVQLNSWFSLAGRNDWMTMDVCFGAAKCDGTAGILIKSA